MPRRYRVLICDDSRSERMRFYSRQAENFDFYGVELREGRFVETDPIDSVEKLHQRILTLRARNELPDLLLLDLFYKRPLPDADERERHFISALLELKKRFLRLKGQALEYLAPSGVDVLRQLREVDGISAAELPVAVYTDKNFNFLPSEELNRLYKLGADTVHKDRDDDPALQLSPAAEYFRLLHTIDRTKGDSGGPGRVFISHGRSELWKDVQSHIERVLRLPTIELEAAPSRGQTVIDKLRRAADRCSHAVIVMTGDDNGASGQPRVRENVMHEIGYFQGRLGHERVVLVYEEGVSIPSNLGGIVYVSFRKGTVADAFDGLKRELTAQ